MPFKPFSAVLAIAACLSLAACGGGGNAPLPDVTTRPMNAVTAINSLLDQYQVVGLSEIHYNQEIWDLVEQVLDADDFYRSRVDIALEGGNSGLQPLMDDFVSGGPTTEAQVKRAWRDNTQVTTTYDAPVYLRMVRHVRDINARRPASQRIRVLLIDPPTDWTAIKNRADHMAFLNDREPSMVRVIEKETYAKKRKLFYVAGGPHVERSTPTSPVKSSLTLLEASHPGTTFTVALHSGFGLDATQLAALERQFASWPKPGIARLRGTDLGRQPADINTAAKDSSGKRIDLYPGIQLQEIFDAILYAGNRGELRTSSPSEGVCTGKPEDEAWKATLLARQVLVEMPPFMATTAEKICKPLPKLYFDQDIFK